MEFKNTERFKNHDRMRLALEDAGEELQGNLSEAELVHLYDINFLAGRWQFAAESKSYFPPGTRTKRANSYE